MSVRVDSVDSQIVELLQEDGRMLYKDIAEKVGVSLPTVKARIKRLMELGLIRKFTVVVDPERVADKVRGIVFARVDPSRLEETLEALSKMGEVRAAHLVSGEKQLFLVVEADGPRGFSELVLRTLPAVGLTDISSHVITRTLKEECGVTVKPNSWLQFRCDFCGAPIYGKPVVKHYYGGRYYFSAEACAQAYKEILDRKLAKRDKSS